MSYTEIIAVSPRPSTTEPYTRWVKVAEKHRGEHLDYMYVSLYIGEFLANSY